MLDREAVKRLNVATLLITGEKTLTPLRMIVEELSRVMPAAERVTIPGATHEMWEDNAQFPGEALRRILENNRGRILIF